MKPWVTFGIKVGKHNIDKIQKIVSNIFPRKHRSLLSLAK